MVTNQGLTNADIEAMIKNYREINLVFIGYRESDKQHRAARLDRPNAVGNTALRYGTMKVTLDETEGLARPRPLGRTSGAGMRAPHLSF
jgi:hypothetical protein